jgi:LuxR family transcriptional regulator, maltose regulon positive regulatory protein
VVMAGFRSWTPPQDASERDRLLATKVTVPRAHPERLHRSRLVEELDKGMARDLVLVCTPAGFGKTTLLADWAQSVKWPLAWLSLDADDNDPVRFWRYVVAALDRAGLAVGEDVSSPLASPSETSGQGLVTALINELEASSDELVVVLDDYHVIESASIHNSVAFLQGHLPPQLHLVIAGRSDPPLPLARLRAAGRLAELRAADLRFSPEESTAFLQDLWRLDLSPEAVATLDSRTEGWAVGLQLAALSLQGRPDVDTFLHAFTGTHRYVLDYLSEEVFERQSDRVRKFLLQSSILKRLSGSVCDAVTGDSNGQAMLEELERANLFLIPLDEERRWYRFHHLFGDLLGARLQQDHPEMVPELHRRAATWSEQHGVVDDAIRHALASGDSRWASRLAEERVDETLRRGESALLERWLSALPDDAVQSRPALSLAQALMLFHVGRLDSVERLLEHAERALDQEQEPGEFELPTDGGMVSEAPAAIALLRAEVASARGDAEGTARHVRLALSQMAEEEYGPRFWARWLMAAADWMSGRLGDAEPAFSEVLVEARAAPASYPMMSTCFTLGRVQSARGRLRAALRTYREGLRFAEEGGRFAMTYHAAEAHLGIARVLYERNELDKALRHVSMAIEFGQQVVDLTTPVLGLVTLAWIRQAMGEADSALDAMDEACRMRPRPEVVALWNPAPAERARLLITQGRASEAARLSEERGLKENDDLAYPSERDYLVLARVLLAQSEPVRALGLLDRLDTLATSQGRMGSVIEISALRSLALQAGGDHRGALAVLGDALSQARPEVYIRVFADEGRPMAALLRSLVGVRRRGGGAAATVAEQEHIDRLIRAFGPTGQGDKDAGAMTGLIEPLTHRELEVLSLIAAGKRNRDIADELVVTLETVKKHASHIFDKLGATNRTEAVTQARELGLIS